MLQITHSQLEENLDFPHLIECLCTAFQSEITVPLRHHHDYANPLEVIDSTLLLMPAWEAGKYLGVKLVTVSPNNQKYNLPSIQGTYLLFDAQKGSLLAMMDAKTLTNWRTAAASALASSYLSNENSSSMLMVGTGALATYLIKAHCAVRPITRVYVWGRDFNKAKGIAAHFENAKLEVSAIEGLEAGVSKVDIISVATLSTYPLIKGDWLKAGQHLDLVGSYKPNMRETDDKVIKRSAVYVDNYEGAMKETGDILIPLEKGILTKEKIRGDLFELCKKERKGRLSSEEITLFKSVGHALEDLAAAQLVYEKLK